MFPSTVYLERRNKLINLIESGIVLLPGNKLKPINYRSNTYRFRQDSTFYYFTGINRPDLFLIIDIDNNKTILFGNDYDEEDFIWMGIMPSLEYLSSNAGIFNVEPLNKLKDFLEKKKIQKFIICLYILMIFSYNYHIYWILNLKI